MQWRIKDFVDGGAIPGIGDKNLLFGKIFAKKCINMKGIGLSMIRYQLVITGADPGFPKGTANVSRKLHESEDNWTGRDGALPKFCYIDPPLGYYIKIALDFI